MLKNIMLILSFSSFLLFTACEKEVTNIKLPQSSSKLVVTSFISPQDTILRASVVNTLPAIGISKLSSESIANAVVTISDKENSVTLNYDAFTRFYSVDSKNFPILPGKTYFLQVYHPDFPQLEASCTVPAVQNNTMEIVVDSSASDYGDFKEYFMQIKWQDIPGENNFYRIYGEMQVRQDMYEPYYQPVYFYENELYSDARLDGARFSSPKASIWKPSGSADMQFKNVLFAYLLNTDEPYYRYHQSLRNFNNTDGNPFAEPVLIYSNVTGGLGVFAAFNRSTVQIELK